MNPLRVVVLGAGVVGVATAYYLWRDGHSVTVIERHDGAGEETSFGNAGGLCPSFAGPWAAPGMIGKVLKMALQRDAAIRFSLWPDPDRLRWVKRWAANCNASSFAVNKSRMQRVAHYSQSCLRQLMVDAELNEFDFHQDGVLQLFRTSLELETGRLATQTLEKLGIPFALMDKAQALKLEPSLSASSEPWTGALHLPADATGDSHKFCKTLTSYLEQRGVVFRFGAAVESIDECAGEVTGLRLTNENTISADAYVVALGNQAERLLRPLGIRLPIYPLKGYSITVPIVDESIMPRASIMDEHYKIMVSRLGNRIRAAGMAELVGYDLARPDERRELLIRRTKALFPAGLDFSKTEFWAGLRPMTPDGPPILGPTSIGRLFLNSGHGSNGWTQACGTSRIVADYVSGRKPAIDTDGLMADRYKMASAKPSTRR